MHFSPVMSLPEIYKDPQLVQWAGVVVNLSVVVLALFLNTLAEHWKRPRFRVDTGDGPPWKARTKLPDTVDAMLMHERIRIRNVGRTAEEACEVRVEQVFRLLSGPSTQPSPLPHHDPRPLKWVGRDNKPIMLSAGAFDLVDLGVCRSDQPDHFILEFGDRGRLNLLFEQDVVRGFRVLITVYGKQGIPFQAAFDLRSDSRDEESPLKMEQVR